MALTDKLAAIADAIRGKTGSTATMTLDQMATEIAAIETGGGDTETEDSLVDGTLSGTYTNARIEEIGAYAFYGQSNLTHVSCANVTTVNSYAFASSGVTSVNLPKLTTINSSGFQTAKTQYVDVSGVTVMKDSAFRQSQLVSAVFPLVTQVNGSTFRDCSKLTKAVFLANSTITLSNTNTFYSCKALQTVDFHGDVKMQASQAFMNSTITALILRSSTISTLTVTSAFTGTPIANGTGYIYVPAALVDSYKVAANWSTYAAQFRAIEDYHDICG